MEKEDCECQSSIAKKEERLCDEKILPNARYI